MQGAAAADNKRVSSLSRLNTHGQVAFQLPGVCMGGSGGGSRARQGLTEGSTRMARLRSNSLVGVCVWGEWGLSRQGKTRVDTGTESVQGC